MALPKQAAGDTIQTGITIARRRTLMALAAVKIRSVVEGLLKEKKSLTEREVKEGAAKALESTPGDVPAGIIRAVRTKMGIDRPRALAHARKMLANDPHAGARAVIAEIDERFGIRIGAPDVSRMRPEGAKKSTGRRASRRRGTGKGRARRASARKAAAPRVVLREAKVPARALTVVAAAGGKASAGGVTVRFEGTGRPDDLAKFFLSLGRTA